MYVGGIVLGAAVLWLVTSAIRSSRRRVNQARGADRPTWAPGIWLCAFCLSTNAPASTSCPACKRPRQDLGRRQVEVARDVIPDRVPVPPGAIVTLHHEARAHRDPGDPHWRVTVGGATVGSAAARDGALALLRALDGVDVVMLDIRGDGPAPYRLPDVIARFDGPRFPLDVACPEAATWSSAGCKDDDHDEQPGWPPANSMRTRSAVAQMPARRGSIRTPANTTAAMGRTRPRDPWSADRPPDVRRPLGYAVARLRRTLRRGPRPRPRFGRCWNARRSNRRWSDAPYLQGAPSTVGWNTPRPTASRLSPRPGTEVRSRAPLD